MKFDTLKYGYSSGALFCVRSFVLLGCNVHTRAHSITLYFQDSIEVAKLLSLLFLVLPISSLFVLLRFFWLLLLPLEGAVLERTSSGSKVTYPGFRFISTMGIMLLSRPIM